MDLNSHRVAAAGWLSAADSAGLLYGAIISAAVLAAVSGHTDHAVQAAAATGVVLVIYWMAHVYIATLSAQLDGDARHFLHRLREAAVHETSVLKGGVPAIVIFLVASALGAKPSSAALAAVYFSIGLLAFVGYLGAHQAGLTGRRLLYEVLGAASFGVLIVIAKSFLH